MNDGLQRSDLDFDALYKQALDSQPLFDATGQSILADLEKQNPALFAGIQFENGGVKSMERAQSKIDGDYAGDHTKITDLTRGRIVVDTPEQVQALRDYIEVNREQLGIETMKDRFANPSDTGFRDINMKMRLPNGHVAEFRIEHRGLLEAAHHTHLPYEKVQEIERRATQENRPLTPDEMFERQRLMDEVRDIHASAANPAGLDSLLNDQGRARLEAHARERLPVLETGKIPDGANFMADIGKRAGLIGGLAMGGLAAGVTLAYGGNAADAAEIAVETTIPYGETALDLAAGDNEAALRSATVETASNIGGLGGMAAGAAAGAALGSAVPVLGTAVGGVAGGVVGAVVGGVAVGTVTDYLLDAGADAASYVADSAASAASYLGDQASSLVGNISDFFNFSATDEASAAAPAAALSTAAQMRSQIDQIAALDSDSWSPETQSLVELRADPQLFDVQYAALATQGSLTHVQTDMQTAAENSATKNASLSAPAAVEERQQTPQTTLQTPSF